MGAIESVVEHGAGTGRLSFELAECYPGRVNFILSDIMSEGLNYIRKVAPKLEATSKY